MYSKHELPIFRTSIFYYDSQYKYETASRVLQILKQHNFYPPQKFFADILTKNRFVPYSEETESLFVKAYGEKDVFGIDMANRNNKEGGKYWRVNWDFTFLKDSSYLEQKNQIIPWNIFRLDASYEQLNDTITYEHYFSCVKELIALIKPFYASLDDVSVSSELLGNTKEKHFVPEYVQRICWGNYWGYDFCHKYDIRILSHCPYYHVVPETIASGVYFTLTSSAFDYNSQECWKTRRWIFENVLL